MELTLIKISRRGGVLITTDKLTGKATPRVPTVKGTVKKTAMGAKGSGRKGTLARSYLRTKTALAQEFQTMKNQASCMISLLGPEGIPPKFEIACMQWALAKFIPRVLRLFPNGHLIRVYGWAPGTGVHAHLAIRFGAGAQGKFKKTEHKLRDMWGEIIGSTDEAILKLTKPGKEALIGYLTSSEKNGEMRVLLHRLDGQRIWGVHGKKNIVRYAEEALFLTPDEWEKFKKILILLAEKAGLPESTIRQIHKINSCACFIPPKLLKKAFKKFRAWRKA